MPDNAVFLDSNIIIYAYSDCSPEKSDIARRVIASGNVVISAQVINEFVAVTHRKMNRPIEAIESAVREFLPFTRPVSLSAETSLLALRMMKEHRFAWYDSLIVASALENGCSLLVSEDLQHGRVIDGSLTIFNPFKKL